MTHRVVVTGGSLISPIGEDWETFERNLRTKKSGIKYMPDWEVYKNLNIKLAAPAIFTQPKYGRKKTRGMGRVALLAVAASERALDVSGLDREEITNGSCGVSYGSSAATPEALLDFHSLLLNNDAKGITATTYIKSMPQTCAVNISVSLGLKGRLITTNTACTAGAMSIGYGYEAIKYGKQTIMICGGAEELNPTSSAVFDTLYATSTMNEEPEKTPRPFDKDRDGLVIGEGGGALILEDLDHAVNRGAKIYAELVGFATNTDGVHITQPTKDTMADVLRMSLDSAGLSPKNIGYINAHGTATTHGDVAESHATREVFGNRVPISSLKGYTGHTLGACGTIEAWASIQMMNNGWFAPNLNLDEVDPECAELDYIVGDGREMSIEYVMTNNFAFGGINSSLIFKQYKGV